VNPFSFLSSWQFDYLSFALGFLICTGLLLFLRKTRAFWRSRGQQFLSQWHKGVARLRSGAEQRFLQDTILYALTYHLGRQLIALDQVYTAPRFLAPQPIADLEYKFPAGAQLNYIWPDLAAGVATPLVPEMSLAKLLRNGQRVVVAGESGTGKTTLLAYVTYLCALDLPPEPYAFLQPVVPAFVHVAELDLGNKEVDPLLPLILALQQRGSPLGRSGISHYLQQKAKTGNLLLLLDGWDELVAERNTAVCQWMQNLLTTYPDLRAIVTACLIGFGPILELGFTWTTIRPWHLSELEHFSVQWGKAFSNNPLPADRYWRPGRGAEETTLRYWLVAQGQVASAVDKPQRRYDLYAQTLNQFINEVADHVPQGLLERFWQHLAYTLQAEGRLALTQSEAAAIAAETLKEKEGQVDLNVVKALQKATAQSALFVQDHSGSLRFLAQSWRDLLASTYMVQQGLFYVAETKIRDPQWAGVLRFYVAQTDPEFLVKKALQTQISSPMRDSLFQVATWLPEVKSAGEWGQQTLILLGQLARQRTFAQVLRLRAVAALVQTGQPGTMAFVQQLMERSDAFLRQAGAVGLSHLGLLDPDRVVKMLQKMLEDGDGAVRETAVSAMTWLGILETEKELLAVLLEGDDHMRRIAAVGLAINGTAGHDILREALEDDEARVRRAAAHGLAFINAPWVEPLLVQLERKDREWVVRAAATEALEKLRSEQKAGSWLPLSLRGVRWLADYALEEKRVIPEGKAALPYLVQVMGQARKPAIRAAAALTLGQLLEKESIPALETAVQDQDSQVQNAAFATLCLVRRAFT
jgi:HEAT repeat protein